MPDAGSGTHGWIGDIIVKQCGGRTMAGPIQREWFAASALPGLSAYTAAFMHFLDEEKSRQSLKQDLQFFKD